LNSLRRSIFESLFTCFTRKLLIQEHTRAKRNKCRDIQENAYIYRKTGRTKERKKKGRNREIKKANNNEMKRNHVSILSAPLAQSV
jgi:hypothetical protein